MNPPFGIQKSKADRKFLDQAFRISHVIYSIHRFNMLLERSFFFHTKKEKEIDVTIYRFVKK
jgi:predicted RNA methylase